MSKMARTADESELTPQQIEWIKVGSLNIF